LKRRRPPTRSSAAVTRRLQRRRVPQHRARTRTTRCAVLGRVSLRGRARRAASGRRSPARAAKVVDTYEAKRTSAGRSPTQGGTGLARGSGACNTTRRQPAANSARKNTDRIQRVEKKHVQRVHVPRRLGVPKPLASVKLNEIPPRDGKARRDGLFATRARTFSSRRKSWSICRRIDAGASAKTSHDYRPLGARGYAKPSGSLLICSRVPYDSIHGRADRKAALTASCAGHALQGARRAKMARDEGAVNGFRERNREPDAPVEGHAPRRVAYASPPRDCTMDLTKPRCPGKLGDRGP